MPSSLELVLSTTNAHEREVKFTSILNYELLEAVKVEGEKNQDRTVEFDPGSD